MCVGVDDDDEIRDDERRRKERTFFMWVPIFVTFLIARDCGCQDAAHEQAVMKNYDDDEEEEESLNF